MINENNNIGNRSSGNYNSGDYNSGNYNSGNRNSGDLNSGDYNSGNYNSGDINSGDINSGDINSGDYNSGDYNSGDYNSGDRNSGWFNTNEPKMRFFNKNSQYTYSEFMNKFDIIYPDLDICQWINWEEMTDQEKKDNLEAKNINGYLKTLDYKEAWAEYWSRADKEEKDFFINLPNFDSDIFEEITGIKIGDNSKKQELLDKSQELIKKASELKQKAEEL